MNAPSTRLGLSVRIADLGDRVTCERIDAFVAEHPQSTLFHRPHWARAVEQGCGQKAAYLIAERGNSLVGCLPLSEIRSHLFGNALVSVGFATGGGVLAEDGRTEAQLAEFAWQLAEKKGFGSAELRGGKVPEGWQATTGTYAKFTRALPAAEHELLGDIPRRQRAEVRRALGFELEVSRGRDRDHRAAHYRVYAESVRNLGTPVFPKSLFDAAIDLFGDSAEVLLVRKDGVPLASLLNFYFKGVCHPYWGGGSREGRQWRANDLIWFEALRGAIARGCSHADFGRSKVGTGPWARKRIWDFEETPLLYAVRTASGAAPREINPLSARYRLQVAAWQRLPLAIANRLGPLIARGLG